MANPKPSLCSNGLLAVLTLALSACVTNPPVATPATSTPTKALTRLDVEKELISKGWQFTAVNGPTNDTNLIFIKPSTYTVTNDVTKITSIAVYGNEAARNYGVPATAFTWEMNCKDKTAKIVAMQGFRDRLANTESYFRKVSDTQMAPIKASTVPSFIYDRVCESGPSSGTGVVVSANRVLTASHVINKCTALEAVHDGKRYPAQLIAQDTKSDLGVLHVQSLISARSVALRRVALTGESVLAAGFPLSGILSSDVIVTTGNVNSLAGLANDQSRLQISAQVSPGNSGGGLLDKSGNLVGIVVSKLDVLRTAAVTGDMAQNVNFAVKPEVVKTFLDSHGVRMNLSDAGARLEVEDLAQRAKEFTVKVECKSRPPAILSSL